MAEGVGFEPTRPFWGLTVFKTAGFNRSPTPPARKHGIHCSVPSCKFHKKVPPASGAKAPLIPEGPMSEFFARSG
jgi:hypothetical protein